MQKNYNHIFSRPIFWFYKEFVVNRHKVGNIEVGEGKFSADIIPNWAILFQRSGKRMQIFHAFNGVFLNK